MLASADDIRQVRPVARNLSDGERINTYILEVEQLQVAPAIGVRLYEALDEGTSTLTEAQRTTLLDGGYYDDPHGDRARCGGLKKAIGYLAYARLINNNQLNTTAFGEVVKKSEFSEPSDEGRIAYAANQSKKVGQAYLDTCVGYLKSIGAIAGVPARVNSVTFKAIGD
ncbi:MAG: hypothetical protein LBF55_05635 [Prevotellaceae bacterium]|jgi:hypothetical protein|nr:hypothetical protein [Prevotellaceae bacterium]